MAPYGTSETFGATVYPTSPANYNSAYGYQLGEAVRKPASVRALEELGKVRLSPSFCMRDFLYSEVASFYGIPNIPDDPDFAIAAGTNLCEELLEPLIATFGPITIVSGYRSPEVNKLCNQKRLNCASNEKNFAAHIWDRKDANGKMGATASILIQQFAVGADWRDIAWWIHENLPYHKLQFFKGGAFNIGWRENPEKSVYSYIGPKGYLARPGMNNFKGDHSSYYGRFQNYA